MRWAFGIQQKIKVAILLAFLMLIILVANLVERRNVFNLHASFTSIYNDRLIPLGDIHRISENLYKKRILLEAALISPELNLENLQHDLLLLNKENDSLITAFKSTYLVTAEAVSLDTLLVHLINYKHLEVSIITLLKNGMGAAAKVLNDQEGINMFKATALQLSNLITIQTEVGKELLVESKQITSNSKLLSTLQVTLVIVLGLIIQVLIMASRTIDVKKPQGFGLN